MLLHGLSVIGMATLWIALICAVIWGLSKLAGKRSYIIVAEPLDIARRSYIRGYLTKTEFEQIAQILR